MTSFYFPIVVGQPNQFFDITLGEELCRVCVRWNVNDASWYCSISNTTKTVNLANFRMCCGKELLLCRGLKTLGYLAVFDAKETGEDPTFLGMGDRFKVGYITRV